ncbi:hypothetical protein H0264_14485 [Nocardia huaxiensis]|uniref:DUF2637 domain-containing protein n=1 Tax=Nocardia huaxiensis TaxID=2755382 RepID=A0A7D6VMN2_9NOCA|nr:hypothetical protein [Nocardia huaxiensis]QLY33276.1 hypothetical protein H0264_14485 [Nocardia huaxiensis]
MTGNDAGFAVGHASGAVPHDVLPGTGSRTPDTESSDSTSRRRSRHLTRQDPHDIGGGLFARLGFACGAILSVLGNWLYTWLPADTQPDGWRPGVAPQIGSAVWPIVLLLSIEVLLRVRWRPGPWWKLARYGGVGTVAIGSAIISYGHVYNVLLSWGYDQIGARVGPLAIDGFMVICGFAMLSESAPAPDEPLQHAHRDDKRSNIFDQNPPESAPTDVTPGTVDRPDRSADTYPTPADAVSEADRDVRIRAAYRNLRSTRKVGELFGLHHSTIADIVAQQTDPDSTSDRNDSLSAPIRGSVGLINGAKQTLTAGHPDIPVQDSRIQKGEVQ